MPCDSFVLRTQINQSEFRFKFMPIIFGIPNYFNLLLIPFYSWLSLLEGTRWLQHMSGLLRAAVTVASAIERDGRPVLVHCSDGWDRTPQIVALAQILLDPYYRTMEVYNILKRR